MGVDVDDATFSTQIPDGLRGPEDATADSGEPLPLMAAEQRPDWPVGGSCGWRTSGTARHWS